MRGLWPLLFLVLLAAACGNESLPIPAPAPGPNPGAVPDAGLDSPPAPQPSAGPDVASPDVAGACGFPRESSTGKLEPRLLEAFRQNPGPRRVFILYKSNPVIMPLPGCQSSGGRQCPERDAAIAAIERMVEEIQRCVVERIGMIGGEFLERFWVGNSTLARLDHAQALDIAGLADVRNLDDGDAPPAPPP